MLFRQKMHRLFDTQPAHLLVVRQKEKKNRLIWVSQKYDRGHLRAAVADLNNDGHEEIVISTGRWCARKGDIIVLEQVRQEKKKK